MIILRLLTGACSRHRMTAVWRSGTLLGSRMTQLSAKTTTRTKIRCERWRNMGVSSSHKWTTTKTGFIRTRRLWLNKQVIFGRGLGYLARSMYTNLIGLLMNNSKLLLGWRRFICKLTVCYSSTNNSFVLQDLMLTYISSKLNALHHTNCESKNTWRINYTNKNINQTK